MIDSENYITPTYQGKKRFAKPILFYWMVAASYKVFGINLFSARLVSAFFGSLCIPLVYMLGRRMFDNKTAIISTLLLPGCYLHFQISRWAITDMAMNFFILLAFYFFICGFQDKSGRSTPYYLAYFCMGVGFMIKGPAALLIPGFVIGGFILILRDWHKLSQLRIIHGVGILMAIILPWFITMLFIHGDEFKNHILGAELRDRIVHDIPFSFYYFGVILRYYLPWSLFFIIALAVQFGFISINSTEALEKRDLISSFKNNFKVCCRELTQKNQAILFCLLWIACPLLIFSLFRIEHSRYMLPISPAFTMITAYFFSQLLDSSSGFQRNIFKIPFYLTGLFYGLIGILLGTSILLLNPVFNAPLGLMSLPLLILCGLVLLFLFYKSKKYFSTIVTLGIIQIAIFTLLNGEALSFFNRYPMKAFANKILADSEANLKIGLYKLGNHRARMGVLTGHASIYLNNPDELKTFIQSEKNAYIVMRQSDWKNQFSELPMIAQATDSSWKKPKNKVKIKLILKNGIKPYLAEYSENYVLLKLKDKE